MHWASLVLAALPLLATTVVGQLEADDLDQTNPQNSILSDSLEIWERCGKKCHRDYSIFTQYNQTTGKTTAWGFDANDGCRRVGNVPYMSICIDWKRNRAHYYYGHHSGAQRRCLKQDDLTKEVYLGCDHTWCDHVFWKEIECVWDTSAHAKGN
ncbi:hypothetical protein GE09DRAFT_191605 [Coniochaeta sp. 2T2.1]|nr:hypothetical protein GE09DRAFT_191605 [Coniochaeta sp. 2T2.1]